MANKYSTPLANYSLSEYDLVQRLLNPPQEHLDAGGKNIPALSSEMDIDGYVDQEAYLDRVLNTVDAQGNLPYKNLEKLLISNKPVEEPGYGSLLKTNLNKQNTLYLLF